MLRRPKVRGIAALILLSTLTACERSADTTANTPPVPESTATESLPRYSASTFFETISFRMPASGHYGLSAESGDLLLSSDETGVYNAWRLDMESGERRALTESTGAPIMAISWFPGDERFLYTQDGGGDELNHVYVQHSDGGVQDLTPGDGLKAGFVGWQDDGTAFYLYTNERDSSAFDLYRYSAEDYSRSEVYRNVNGIRLGALSGDGRWLSLVRTNSNADSDLYIVDLAADKTEPQLITPHEGNIEHSEYVFTPDNSKLVFGTDAHGEFTQAWTHDLASGEQSPLIVEDWDVMYVSYSRSGRYRISAINRDARTAVTVVDRNSGDPVALPPLPDGDLTGLRLSRDENRIALSLNGDTSPPDVYSLPLDGGSAQRLTRALNPAVDAGQLVEGEVVRFASYDDREIPGILYRPREASASNPVPALVWVHGGPGGQSRKGYSATIQHLVNHGYAVYRINNRGSSGYGKTFNHLDDRRHGEADLGDVVASKNWLAGMDWVRAEQIGIAGGSYGGYMVAAALAFEPEAFNAGINIFGVTNWLRTIRSIPDWWGERRSWAYTEMGDPATDGERLRRISPLFHAGNIRRPLLVLQGANDPRVLQIESDELVASVRENGVPVEYVLFDDEGHGFRKRENRVTASEAYLRFLDTHLKGDGV